jgi:hypothetical protein
VIPTVTTIRDYHGRSTPQAGKKRAVCVCVCVYRKLQGIKIRRHSLNSNRPANLVVRAMQLFGALTLLRARASKIQVKQRSNRFSEELPVRCFWCAVLPYSSCVAPLEEIAFALLIGSSELWIDLGSCEGVIQSSLYVPRASQRGKLSEKSRKEIKAEQTQVPVKLSLLSTSLNSRLL